MLHLCHFPTHIDRSKVLTSTQTLNLKGFGHPGPLGFVPINSFPNSIYFPIYYHIVAILRTSLHTSLIHAPILLANLDPSGVSALVLYSNYLFALGGFISCFLILSPFIDGALRCFSLLGGGLSSPGGGRPVSSLLLLLLSFLSFGGGGLYSFLPSSLFLSLCPCFCRLLGEGS